MKVLIVGAGIAGCTLALALDKAGLESHIVEARPGVDTGGAFLALAPNGVNALRTLDLGGIPETAGGFVLSGLDFRNAKGRRIAQLDGEQDEARYGAPSILLQRARLQRELASRVSAAGIRTDFDTRVLDVVQDAAGVTATLDAGDTVRADALVGADGIFSTIRQLAWPEAQPPRYTGIIDCGGWTDVDLPETARQQMHFGREAFFGHAIRNGTAYWFSNFPRSQEPERAELDRIEGPAWMSQLRALHAADPAPIPGILAAATDSAGAWPIYDLPDPDEWSTSRICLIGDAAHAMSPSAGQGASLAIEDGVVLAQSLRDHNDPSPALERFVQARKPRAEKIVKFGRQIGERKISSAASNVVRDLGLPLFLRMGARATADQYGYSVEWDADAHTSL